MGTSNSGYMRWGDIMLMLSMEPGTASRSIHNHFFLFKSAAILLYFCAILASFKKELKFKSKDIFFIYFPEVFCV